MSLSACVALGSMCAVAILLPLGFKWALDKSIFLPWSLAISALSGSIVYWCFQRLDFPTWLSVLVVPGLAGVVSGGVLAWRFFRDPNRIPPAGESIVLSPADGKVVYIKPIGGGEAARVQKRGAAFELSEVVPADLLEDAAWLVGISMSYLDVHVNRAPIAGTATCVRHIPGSFMSLKRPEAVFQNERMLTVIDGGWMKVAVIQIASRLVRRIVSYISESSVTALAQRIGKITLGSQVDVVITRAPNLRIMVKTGQHVRAGLSVIASRWPEGGSS